MVDYGLKDKVAIVTEANNPPRYRGNNGVGVCPRGRKGGFDLQKSTRSVC